MYDGGVDENRNVKKLSYAASWMELRAKPMGMDAQQKPHRGKAGKDREEEGHGCVYECM